ncbi:hypothetical protein CXF59_01080 [Flavobacterium sp. ALD4]|uniref:hypothetical protein n=1 Tax=Flavobacterium sp. ALD4 TaxID=2058314 RepID=UPI000C3436B6|nr:hypothetical protein [Flavobacterium sp. ALD4]PKH68900.1 hypothetical protein CXF59_01080 [Flavobacterium sp. ALD4]
MKKIILTLLLIPVIGFSQGKSISLAKKSKEPYITIQGDTLKVDMQILIKEGSNENGKFKYVQVINNFNEPLYQADSRAAFKRQLIKFFKEQDGAYYLFTNYFCINIEAALSRNEIELLTK